MAIVNTSIATLLKEGSNVTLTQDGQVITIATTGGGATPGGSDTQIQFNDGGAFGGDAGLTYDKTNNIVDLESIDFATTPTAAAATYRLNADDSEGSLNLGLKGGNVNIALGAEVVIMSYNAEATTLNKGEVVYLYGAQGQRPSVKRASNTADSTSAATFGMVAESIASGAEGFVIQIGVLRNIDTNAYNEGDILWLGSTAGSVTTTKPYAPNHGVFVGVVLKKNATSGRIFVKPQNGYEMDELHNVSAQSPSNNDILAYNTSTSLWEKKQLSAISGITGTGTTNYLPKFTGASTIGNSTIQDLTTGVLVSPSVTASGAIARGLNHTPSLTAAANNDVLVGLDINPTFTNGAFTGVSNLALRVNGTARIQSSPSVNSDSTLYILPTTNNSTASATLYGIREFSTISTINSSSSYIGFSSANNASSNTAAVSGIESNVNVSAGTTTTARTFISNSAVTGTGTITTHIGYDYVDVFKGGSGVLTRQFGVRINNIVNGSSANVGLLFNDSGSTSVNGTWDIYSQSNNNSYLKGNLLLNTTTDSGYKLDVNGTARVTSDALINGHTIGRGLNSISTNLAVGFAVFGAITTGDRNTSVGANSAQVISSGQRNTSIGAESLIKLTTGSYNTGIGFGALYEMTTSSNNTALGYVAGRFINAGTNNTTSNNSIFIGYDTRSSADGNTNEIIIGYNGRGNGSNTITIGNTSTANNYIFGNFNVTDANNIILGTTTGTKIGTATTQKIGFFNATPVVQPGAVTTAQGIADALTSLGLLASSTVTITDDELESAFCMSSFNYTQR